MSDPKTTSVVVYRTRLNSLRGDPQDSMDNVIVRLLDAQGVPDPIPGTEGSSDGEE